MISKQEARAARDAALVALTTDRNVSRVAKIVGRSRQTLHEWLKEPAFVEELDKRRRARAEEFLAKHLTADVSVNVTPAEMDRLDSLAAVMKLDRDGLVRAALWRGVEALECAGAPPRPEADTGGGRLQGPSLSAAIFDF